jgi:hypothetical protein
MKSTAEQDLLLVASREIADELAAVTYSDAQIAAQLLEEPTFTAPRRHRQVPGRHRFGSRETPVFSVTSR